MAIALGIFPIFALILLGAVLRRAMHLPEAFWPALDRLIYYIFFPALLFTSLSTFRVNLGEATPMLQVGFLFTLAGIGLGYLAKWLFDDPPHVFASAFQTNFRFNSYVGLAAASSVYGPSGLAAIGLLIGFLVPLANVAAVWQLARHTQGRLWREIVLNPLILSTAGGITFSLLEWELPALLAKTLSHLSQASLPLGLIAVGAALRLRGLGKSRGHLWYGVAIKLLVLPAIAWELANLYRLQGVYFAMAVVMAALPVSTVAYVLSTRMGGDGDIIATQVALTTLFSMATLPFWLSLVH